MMPNIEEHIHKAIEEGECAVDVFRGRIAGINQVIRKYNLEVPSPQFQLSLLDVEKEISQIKT